MKRNAAVHGALASRSVSKPSIETAGPGWSSILAPRAPDGRLGADASVPCHGRECVRFARRSPSAGRGVRPMRPRQGLLLALTVALAWCAPGATLFAPAAAAANVRHCPNQRIPNQGIPVSVWSIAVQNTPCAAAREALASAIVWRFATPAWNLDSNGVPTRWAPPGWRRCTVLGLWVNARSWSDGNVRGSVNRCTASGGRVLRFSWVHTGPWWVNETGCHQGCPVTRTKP